MPTRAARGQVSVGGTGQWLAEDAFSRHSSGVQWPLTKETPVHQRERGSSWDAIGAPSAGLSLVGLLASRARLRFARHLNGNRSGWREQGHGKAEWISTVVPWYV